MSGNAPGGHSPSSVSASWDWDLAACVQPSSVCDGLRASGWLTDPDGRTRDEEERPELGRWSARSGRGHHHCHGGRRCTPSSAPQAGVAPE